MKKHAAKSDPSSHSRAPAVTRSELGEKNESNRSRTRRGQLRVVKNDGGETGVDRWDLRLYIAGETLRSRAAVLNLKKICDEYLSNYNIEVIDLLKDPALARGDQIVALPTLVRKIPSPMRKIIGDLSNTDRVLVGLDLRPRTK